MSIPHPIFTATKYLLSSYLVCLITGIYGLVIIFTVQQIFSLEEEIAFFGMFLGLFPAIEITGRFIKNLYGYRNGSISSNELLEGFSSKRSRRNWINFLISTILGVIFLVLAMMNEEGEVGMMRFFGVVATLLLAAAILALWIEKFTDDPNYTVEKTADESVIDNLLDELDALGGTLQVRLPATFNKWLKSPMEGKYYTLEDSQYITGQSPSVGDEVNPNQALFVIEKNGLHHEVLSGVEAIIEEVFPTSLEKVEKNDPIYRLRKKEVKGGLMNPLV